MKSANYTSTIIYLGDLRTEATHLQSGNVILTDAPTDNQGKGEAFSPTDLVATALASCMLTIMGIVAKRHNLEIEGAFINTKKIMADNPRRIGAIKMVVEMPENNFTDKDRQLLENAAHTCPVSKSLHPDIQQEIEFVWK